jgi:hypothetical protein
MDYAAQQARAYPQPSGASIAKETVSSCLEETGKTLQLCHEVAGALEQKMAIALPPREQKVSQAGGLTGLAFALRSSAMELRERLERLNAEL